MRAQILTLIYRNRSSVHPATRCVCLLALFILLTLYEEKAKKGKANPGEIADEATRTVVVTWEREVRLSWAVALHWNLEVLAYTITMTVDHLSDPVCTLLFLPSCTLTMLTVRISLQKPTMLEITWVRTPGTADICRPEISIFTKTILSFRFIGRSSLESISRRKNNFVFL